MNNSQCRAARGLLDWTQPDLSKHASVGKSTINRFERGLHEPRPAMLAAIRRALEGAGVEFIEGGVRMKPKG